MKQTVIDWLAEKIFSEATFIAVANNEDELAIEVSVIKRILKQAKEIEKQQIVDAANSENSIDINHGEQYYKVTFKSE